MLRLGTTLLSQSHQIHRLQAIRHASKAAKYVTVVLKQDVDTVGPAGLITNVRPGHMRNLLYPSGKAVYATPENIDKFKLPEHILEGKVSEWNENRRWGKLKRRVLIYSRSAEVSGKLKDSIEADTIWNALTDYGSYPELSRENLTLVNDKIEHTGVSFAYLKTPVSEKPFEVRVIVKPILDEADMNAKERQVLAHQKEKEQERKKKEKKQKLKHKK